MGLRASISSDRVLTVLRVIFSNFAILPSRDATNCFYLGERAVIFLNALCSSFFESFFA